MEVRQRGSDGLRARRRIEQIHGKDEPMFVRDGKRMAVGPAGLPAQWCLHRQCRRGIEPSRCAATALLCGHANHPADRVGLGFDRHIGGSGWFANTTGRLDGRLLGLMRATAGRIFLFRESFLWGWQLASMRTAAAAGLALLRRAATADLLSAGIRTLPRRFRHRRPDDGDEVRQQRHAGAEPTAQNPPNRFTEIKEHWQKNGSRRELPSSMT